MAGPKTLVESLVSIYAGVSSETAINNLLLTVQTYKVPVSFVVPDAGNQINLRVAKNDIAKTIVKLNGWAEASGLPNECIDIDKVLAGIDHENYPDRLRYVSHIFQLASGRLVNHLANRLEILKSARNEQSINEIKATSGLNKSGFIGPEVQTQLTDTKLAKIKAERNEIQEQIKTAIIEQLSTQVEIENDGQA